MNQQYTFIICIWFAFGAIPVRATEISREYRKTLNEWASKNQRSLIAESGIRIVLKSIPKEFVDAKVGGKDLKKRDVIYFDLNSGRFYFDTDSFKLLSKNRASAITHRTYAKLNSDNIVALLEKKPVFHQTVRFKIDESEDGADQPATAPKTKSDKKPKLETEGRSQ